MEVKSLKKETYKLLIDLIKYKKWLYFMDLILWILVYVIPLLFGLISKFYFNAIDKGIVNNTVIIEVIVLLVITAVGRTIVLRLSLRIDTRHRFYINSLLKRNTFNYLLYHSKDKQVKLSSGEMIGYIRDDVEQMEVAVNWTIDIICNLGFAIVAIAILFSIDIKMTLIIFIPVFLVISISQKLSSTLEKIRVKSRKASSNVTGAIGEVFNTIQAIKVNHAEDSVLEYFNSMNETRYRFMLKDKLLETLVDTINSVPIILGQGAILILGIYKIKDNTFNLGDLILFINYLTYITDFTLFFGEFLAKYKQTKVSCNRMSNIVDCENNRWLVENNDLYFKNEYQMVKQKKNIEPLKTLEVKNLSCMINGVNTIRNISFFVNKGEKIIITGRVGSGKTTLLKTIIGLNKMSSGAVYWNDTLITDNEEFFQPPYSAYTPQTPYLVSDTIKNNILLNLSEDQVDMNEIVKLSVLDSDINEFEQGLDTNIGSKGVRLSGGQIQRVAAGRMLARNSEILFFDDISSALDIETENKFWERIKHKKDITYIAVSNKKSAFVNADKIIVMKNGEIHAIGDADELLRDNMEFRIICNCSTE